MERRVYNVVIVGGMAAGCSAAARLSRLSPDFHVTIIERGSYISLNSCGLPMFVSGEIDDVSNLSKTPYGVVRDEKYFREVKAVRVLTQTEVVEIDTARNEVTCRGSVKDQTFVLPFDSLILSTGSEAVKPDFPCPPSPLISAFHAAEDAVRLKKAAQQGKIGKAVIIGGNLAGCELTEALTTLWGIQTVLIEKDEFLLSDWLDAELSAYLEGCIVSEKTQLLLSKTVDRVETDKNGLPVVFLADGQRIECDYVLYSLGSKPNTCLALKSGIKTGKNLGIVVDDQMRTNIHNVRAAGDCVEANSLLSDEQVFSSSGSLSNRMGRVAADSIAGRPASFPAAAGNVSLQCFDRVACAAGLTQSSAMKLGYDAASVIGCWSSRADYDPEGKPVFGKLVYEKGGLRLLGLQLVGEGEFTGYVDVFMELLRERKAVVDLVNAEHAFEPVHSSPVSPLNHLGSMALDQELDGVRNVSPLLLQSFSGIMIDVREPLEVDSLTVPWECFHVPLPELRSRLNDFETDCPIICACSKGSRGYEAARVLLNNGFKDVSYLGGGFLLYESIRKLGYESSQSGSNSGGQKNKDLSHAS